MQAQRWKSKNGSISQSAMITPGFAIQVSCITLFIEQMRNLKSDGAAEPSVPNPTSVESVVERLQDANESVRVAREVHKDCEVKVVAMAQKVKAEELVLGRLADMQAASQIMHANLVREAEELGRKAGVAKGSLDLALEKQAGLKRTLDKGKMRAADD